MKKSGDEPIHSNFLDVPDSEAGSWVWLSFMRQDQHERSGEDLDFVSGRTEMKISQQSLPGEC